MSKSFWDSVAMTDKIFTHPLPVDWIRQHVEQNATILEVGCGYGRNCHELLSLGYRNVTGADISNAMIRRAAQQVPDATFLTMEKGRLPAESESVDAVFLIAVLTCIIHDEDQIQLVSEIARVLRPEGTLFLSDYPLQNDERNLNRYNAFAEKYDRYGVFEIDEGRAIMRHFDRPWLDDLFERFGFSPSEERELSIMTMNRNPATILQRCLRRE